MVFEKGIYQCDAQLLNESPETDLSWDDAVVVSAGKLKKLWDSLSELRSSLCEGRLERTVLRPALLSVKTAQFTLFFLQIWHDTVKSHSLTESVERLTFVKLLKKFSVLFWSKVCCEVWGFQGSNYKEHYLLGSPFFWDITQPIMVIPYRRLGTDCPKTSVRNYRYLLRNIAG